MAHKLSLILIGLVASFVAGQNPMKTLDYGTFKGKIDYETNTENYLGMPFAVAGRLQNPRVIGAQDKLKGIQDATDYGSVCPQQELAASPLNAGNAKVGALLGFIEQLGFYPLSNQAEDCLHINVQMPNGTKKGDKLPVFMWIHGGGFELGASNALGAETTVAPHVIYKGQNLVARSVEMEQPIIYVSANHRLNAFGTLASRETVEAGVTNLLLKDQRTAMMWIQKYIAEFGGDPDKVTLFGESAGSVAIATHMLLNNGDTEGLFHAAIMLSGSIQRLDGIDRSQQWFDQIIDAINCGEATDKIQCFREAEYGDIYNAVQQLPTFLSYESTLVPWWPRPDGTYLLASPHTLLQSGKVADIPYIIGDLKDEGTLFSLVNQLNVTTNDDVIDYFNQVYYPNITREQVESLTELYSSNPAAGSPYGTGQLNAIGPQYKRIASLIGDITFQSGRRDLLQYTAHKQNTWTYFQENSLPLLGKLPLLGGSPIDDLPILGSFHASDVIFYVFGTIPASISANTLNLQSTFISFVNHHDPNQHGLPGLPYWPTYDTSSRQMFRFKEDGPDIISDTYREKQIDWINEHGDWYRN